MYNHFVNNFFKKLALITKQSEANAKFACVYGWDLISAQTICIEAPLYSEIYE